MWTPAPASDAPRRRTDEAEPTPATTAPPATERRRGGRPPRPTGRDDGGARRRRRRTPGRGRETAADRVSGRAAEAGRRRRVAGDRAGGRVATASRTTDGRESGRRAPAGQQHRRDRARRRRAVTGRAATSRPRRRRTDERRQPPAASADGEAGNRRRRRPRPRSGQRDRDARTYSRRARRGRRSPRPARRGLRVPPHQRASCRRKDDVYVSVKQVRQFGLRAGDHAQGRQPARPAATRRTRRCCASTRSTARTPRRPASVRRFEDLTPLFPDEPLPLEPVDDPSNMTARIIDLISPIGKGQRGLIVSPPKAGKTTIMKQIARSIEANNPEVHLFVLLVDERPEEVTDMRRWLKGEARHRLHLRPARPRSTPTSPSSPSSGPSGSSRRATTSCIILDGITRLARAYNLAAPATGRIMSGGIDTGALYPPKKFFGAARNVEEGGSLTILATALVETGSRDGRGDLRGVQGHRQHGAPPRPARWPSGAIYPAIDVDASLHPPRGAALPRQPAPAGVEAAPGAVGPRPARAPAAPASSCSSTG